MKKTIARAFVFCILAALLLGGVTNGGAEGEIYICKPTSFSAVYYPDSQNMVCRGSYEGWIQSNRTYFVMMTDANGGMIIALSPQGSEIDPTGSDGTFEYSFSFAKSEYDKLAKPLKIVLRCQVDPRVIRPISATVVLPLLGDANHDGTVDNIDAAKILMYDAGSAPIDLDAADVDGDGMADNLDAAMILRYDAGLISGFGQ